MAHMAVGKVGDSVQTSQVDIQLSADVLTIPLFGSLVSVPAYISAAEGTATISEIPCAAEGTVTSLVATTGAVNARIGTSDSSGATINLLVASMRISGSAQAASSGPTEVDFSRSDIDDGMVKTVSSNVTLMSDLGSAIQLEGFSVLGLPIFGLSGLVNTLVATISTALVPLDAVVDSLLTTLGVKLGAMDMIVHGAKCRAPVLVG